MSVEPTPVRKKVTVEDVKNILVTHTGVPEEVFIGSQEESLEGLGVDSLAVMELDSVLYGEHGCRLPEDAISLTTEEIVDRVNSTSLDLR